MIPTDVLIVAYCVLFVCPIQFDVKTVRGRRSEATTRTIDVGRFTPTSGFNRYSNLVVYELRNSVVR